MVNCESGVRKCSVDQSFRLTGVRLTPKACELVNRGQTREICEKQENYFKRKVVTFTVQSFILYQYAAVLQTFSGILLKKF